ncbi:MAG TPA: hypothetical protein VIF62_35350 [Labilithrix sp.]
MNPVCGCDHQTYWNAELAAAAGVNLSSATQCGDGVALKCSNGTPKCAGGAFCNDNVGPIATCGVTSGAGTCWVMPATCPTATQTEKACNGSGGCRTLCDAIKNERTFGLDSVNCP